MNVVVVQSLSHIVVQSVSATPWTVARQAPLFVGLPRQEDWSRLPLPPPSDLPNPGMEHASSKFLGVSEFFCGFGAGEFPGC